jgi:hypothetical protein
MAPVKHVIPVIDVVDVYIVGFVPVRRPVFRPRVYDAEPEAPILEAGESPYDQDWCAVHAKPVSTAEMRTEAGFRNVIAPVTPALAPGTMFTLPIVRAMALPSLSRSGVVIGFVPDYLAHMSRPIRSPIIWLRPFSAGLVCPLLLVRAFFVSPLRPIRLVSIRVLRCR